MVESCMKSNDSVISARRFAIRPAAGQNWWPLGGAAVLPLFLGFLDPDIRQIILKLLWWSLLLLTPAIILHAACMWRRSNGRPEFVWGKFIREILFGAVDKPELKFADLPALTIGLILANTALFYIVPDEILERQCQISISDLGLLQITILPVTCGFLHADFSKPYVNMVFLWVFGATFESRIGRCRFIGAYFLGSVISNLICLNLLLDQIHLYDDQHLFLQYHAIGASGAIAGLMGMSVVRCHFDRFAFSLPVVCKHWFASPLRINGFLLIGLFFAMHLAGRRNQMLYNIIMIDYWGHVGGFLAGVVLALIFACVHGVFPFESNPG